MIRHLTRIDGRFAFFIEDAILELLSITEDTPLEVKTDGTRLLLRPLPVEDEDQTSARGVLNSMIPQPAPVLKKAADSSLDDELFGDDDDDGENDAHFSAKHATKHASEPESNDDELSFAKVLASEEEPAKAPLAPIKSKKDPLMDLSEPDDDDELKLTSDLDGDLMGALEDAFDKPVPAQDGIAPPQKTALKNNVSNKEYDDEELQDLEDLPPLSDEGDALASVDLEEDLFDQDELSEEDDALFSLDDEPVNAADSVEDQALSEESSEETPYGNDENSESFEEVSSLEAEPINADVAVPPVSQIAPALQPADALPPPPVASNGPEVVVFLNDKEVLRTPLRGPRMIIGRESKADIHLDQRALSRRHACIEKRGAAIWVQDLGSANKTYVNDEIIEEPVRMNAGDRIQVGHYEIVLEGLQQASTKTPVISLEGPEGSHRFAMVGDQITIGRAQSCDISISHKSISRRHLTINIDDHGGFIVEDLGSQNGVTVRGQTIDQPTPLQSGESFEICEFTLSVGFLEEEETSRKECTMLIDPRSMAKAAYVDGDFENVRSSQGDAPSTKARRKRSSS